eukprot:c15330_g1_i1.p1 GENE.c15330_g1_i1~~c15330_g1_i1.p1  ORF type:complete len:1129 (-),score=244.77 c15330_g1_i1:110-3466(-)
MKRVRWPNPRISFTSDGCPSSSDSDDDEDPVPFEYCTSTPAHGSGRWWLEYSNPTRQKVWLEKWRCRTVIPEPKRRPSPVVTQRSLRARKLAISDDSQSDNDVEIKSSDVSLNDPNSPMIDSSDVSVTLVEQTKPKPSPPKPLPAKRPNTFSDESEESDDLQITNLLKRKAPSTSAAPAAVPPKKFKQTVLLKSIVLSSESSSSESDVEIQRKASDKGKADKPNSTAKLQKTQLTLAQSTKSARELEEQRRQRVSSTTTASKLPVTGGIILNTTARSRLFAELRKKDAASTDAQVWAEVNETEPEVRLSSTFHDRAKAHQIEGIQFMWDHLCEGVEQTKSSKGFGCVLAHSMGLGKTFQVVSLVVTILTHAKILKLKTVLVVLPKNVLRNWVSEFRKWTNSKLPIECSVSVLEDEKTLDGRIARLSRWQKTGGVMLVAYGMYQSLVSFRSVKRKAYQPMVTAALQSPGPDLLFLDEGHVLRNHKSSITKCLMLVATNRRVVMTGSPLQNNLMEYHTMVNFARENFLGSRSEFTSNFERPIKAGQHADSSAYDVKLMKKRTFVLYKLVSGIVHRRGFEVLQRDLPAKHEYVLLIRLSPLQRALYQRFLSERSTTARSLSNGLFYAFQNLIKVWNHPGVLALHQQEKANDEEMEDLNDFLASEGEEEKDFDKDDDNQDDLLFDDNHLRQAKKQSNPNEQAAAPTGRVRWWGDMIDSASDVFDDDHSGKMLVLLAIIQASLSRNERVVVFSQSIPTLNLIEAVLQRVGSKLNGDRSWSRGRQYFRLDGQTSSMMRHSSVKQFNNLTNSDAVVFLVSTLAGSLGINLVAANRVVIFDACWNPSHDLQALFRCYRYGQTKEVFVYRLLSAGTMEEKIYDRQVAKQGMAERVVEKHQVARIYQIGALAELFTLDPDPDDDSEIAEEPTEGDVIAKSGPRGTEAYAIPDGLPPKDTVLADILLGPLKSRILRYHNHDSLLRHTETEELSAEDRELAWQEHIARQDAEKLREQQIAALAAMGPNLGPNNNLLAAQMRNSSMNINDPNNDTILPTFPVHPRLYTPLQASMIRPAGVATSAGRPGATPQGFFNQGRTPSSTAIRPTPSLPQSAAPLSANPMDLRSMLG